MTEVIANQWIVCKFGGSSVANAVQLQKVCEIVRADPRRRYVVVSAPGKRSADDHKITDLLYLCHAHVAQGIPFDDVFQRVAERYREMVVELGLSLDIERHLAAVKRDIERERSADFTASRGEYLAAQLLSELLRFPFVDAARLIFFDEHGRINEERTYRAVRVELSGIFGAVIPGFYGTDAAGQVKTLPRGGSDITGALIARGVGAAIYENWTDTCGLLAADPGIVANPKPIDILSYSELRELAYMGSTVLHDEAIFPVQAARIPVHICNTNDHEAPGTLIVADDSPLFETLPIVTGIAGRKNFLVIEIKKVLMNNEVGFCRRVLSILEAFGISFEHLPTSIDTMNLVVADAQLGGKLDQVLTEIRELCKPDSIEVYPAMALIATVGRRMRRTKGIAAKLFGALAQADINVRMIDQGSSETNIIVGVENTDYEEAIRAIYQAFCT